MTDLNPYRPENPLVLSLCYYTGYNHSDGYTQSFSVCSVYLSTGPLFSVLSLIKKSAALDCVSHTVNVFLAGDVGVPGPPGAPGVSAGKTVLNIISHQIMMLLNIFFSMQFYQWHAFRMSTQLWESNSTYGFFQTFETQTKVFCVDLQVAHTVLLPQALKGHLDCLVHLEEMEVGLDQPMWASILQNTFRVSYVFIYVGLYNVRLNETKS